MKNLLWCFLCFGNMLTAQIVGTVQNSAGEPLPYVNIYLKDSFKGTTSNEVGKYTLDISNPGDYELVFQFLGYETQSLNVSVDRLPYTLDVQLSEATLSLDEVVISPNEDPAYRIVRATINQRKENLKRISSFKANFYSRGIWRVKDAPESILGQEIGDFDGALDSTRTGIIYLSETISEIAYQKPSDFKERIIASKVSGNDNGFSFNSAQEANFSFYENTIDLNASIVSPIASNALNYYRYQLDGVFFEGNKLINKIIVSPKRPKDRVWQGIIYIVEDDWQLYGVELTTNGDAIQIPFVKELIFKQNFKFDVSENAWIKISQNIDFSFGFLGLNGNGRFIAVYSDYEFQPQFDKKDFSNEVLFFEPLANKKDSLFWKEIRPVPLTTEEVNDYLKKDSIQELRKSKPYLDSIDGVKNKLKPLDLLFGYRYQNSFQKWSLEYEAPLPGIHFNTVQGCYGQIGLRFKKRYDEYGARRLDAWIFSRYSEAEDRFRFFGGVAKRFNRNNRLRLGAYAGTGVVQFNSSQPISPLINSVSTLFFQRNNMKLYELTYAKVSWSQELVNGIYLLSDFGYEQRKELFNNTDQTFFPEEGRSYTSNNPLAIGDFEILNPAVVDHHLYKTNISLHFSFAQKYMTYPDGKFNLGNNKYPRFVLRFQNALGASDTRYNHSNLEAQLQQQLDLENLGEFTYNLKGGTFFDGEQISFVDYKHFNGNQTRVGTAFNYTEVFNLLPYYQLSTNKSYFEAHAEHNFQGLILGKIPGINQLNFNLIAGGHFLATETNQPYSELSLGIDNLGWGKYRQLRVDYVRSFFNGQSEGAFVFGLKFLNFFD